MKTPTSKKLLLISSLLTLVFAFAAPVVRAEEGAKEKKVSKKDLAAYDANKDGQLDDAEKAAMKADKSEKAKAKKKAKAAGKAESASAEK